MNILKMNEIDNELNILRDLKNKYKDDEELGKQLTKRGYELKTLGTGDSSRILNREVVFQKLHTRKYLNGYFVVVGVAPEVTDYRTYKKVYFKGYVKEVK